jgi:hypothetical protein
MVCMCGSLVLPLFLVFYYTRAACRCLPTTNTKLYLYLVFAVYGLKYIYDRRFYRWKYGISIVFLVLFYCIYLLGEPSVNFGFLA